MSTSSPLPPPASSSFNYENPTVPLTTDDAAGGVFWKLLHQFHASIGSSSRISKCKSNCMCWFGVPVAAEGCFQIPNLGARSWKHAILSVAYATSTPEASKQKVPKIGGKTLDLHLLFVEVTSRGGFEKVVSDRRWKEVIAAFNFPSTITSASFVIRKYYVSLLYQFEEAYYFGKQVPLPLPQISEPAQPASPEPHQGSSVIGVIDGKFDSGYLVSVKIGGEVLKGVLYHIPQAPQISETTNCSTISPCERTKRSQKS